MSFRCTGPLPKAVTKRKKTVVRFCYSTTLRHCYIYKCRYRHKLKMLMACYQAEANCLQTKRSQQLPCMAWFLQKPSPWHGGSLYGPEPGQGGAEVVKHCFILYLSCPSQRDECYAQRYGDGENLFITNMGFTALWRLWGSLWNVTKLHSKQSALLPLTFKLSR